MRNVTLWTIGGAVVYLAIIALFGVFAAPCTGCVVAVAVSAGATPWAFIIPGGLVAAGIGALHGYRLAVEHNKWRQPK